MPYSASDLYDTYDNDKLQRATQLGEGLIESLFSSDFNPVSPLYEQHTCITILLKESYFDKDKELEELEKLPIAERRRPPANFKSNRDETSESEEEDEVKKEELIKKAKLKSKNRFSKRKNKFGNSIQPKIVQKPEVIPEPKHTPSKIEEPPAKIVQPEPEPEPTPIPEVEPEPEVKKEVVLPSTALGMEKRKIRMDQITSTDYYRDGKMECHPYYARLNNQNCWISKYQVSITGI